MSGRLVAGRNVARSTKEFQKNIPKHARLQGTDDSDNSDEEEVMTEINGDYITRAEWMKQYGKTPVGKAKAGIISDKVKRFVMKGQIRFEGDSDSDEEYDPNDINENLFKMGMGGFSDNNLRKIRDKTWKNERGQKVMTEESKHRFASDMGAIVDGHDIRYVRKPKFEIIPGRAIDMEFHIKK